jgi:GNAT superfamily N-acetyltransferase
LLQSRNAHFDQLSLQMIDFAIRRMRPAESFDDVTALLHRAFAELTQQGFECQSAGQTAASTRERALRGECFIAVSGCRVVGTVTLERSCRTSLIEPYCDPSMASIHQLAVDPQAQGNGIGSSLIAHAAAWARARKFDRLALDTPEAALRQVAWYFRQGFDAVDAIQVPGRKYISLVLVKALSCRVVLPAARASYLGLATARACTL